MFPKWRKPPKSAQEEWIQKQPKQLRFFKVFANAGFQCFEVLDVSLKAHLGPSWVDQVLK